MGTHRSIAALLGTFLVAAAAFGDGKAFPSLADPAPMPDQRALIHFADGVQTLVIDTAIETDAPELAWVVPVPSRPEIRACDPGVFTTLEVIFRPRVNTRAYGAWGFSVFAGILLWICMRVRRASAFIGAILMFLVGVFLFLPALQVSRSAVSATYGVDVLERQRVGSYDVTTIASDDPSALVTWLTEHGYHIDEPSRPAIEAYVNNGWVFVVSRLAMTEGAQEVCAPHPLALTFPAEKPVYPMRLTGTQGEDLDVTLYVFADRGAEADGFEVVRSSEVERDEASSYPRRRASPHIVIAHDGLLTLLPECLYATQLGATLTPEQMRQDVMIDLVPFAERGSMLEGTRRAATRSLHTGALVFLVGIVALYIPAMLKWIPPRRVNLACGLAACVGIVVTGVMMNLNPGVSVERRRPWSATENLHSIYTELCAEVEREFGATERLTPELIPEIERFSRDWFSTHAAPENAITGQAVREEASPGNYLLRRTDGRLDFLIHDLTGSAEPLPIVGAD